MLVNGVDLKAMRGGIVSAAHTQADIDFTLEAGSRTALIGISGAGKSSLLKIMAGEDQSFVGEAFPAAGISVGFLHQEPRLDPTKNVLGNVEEGVASVRALLTRFDEINARFGEEMSSEEMDKLMEDQARVQDAIEAARQMEPYNVVLFEQPTPRDDYEGIAEVRKHVSMPVMADDMVFTFNQARECLRHDAVDVISSAASGQWTKGSAGALRRMIPYQNLFYLRGLFDRVQEGMSP